MWLFGCFVTFFFIFVEQHLSGSISLPLFSSRFCFFVTFYVSWCMCLFFMEINIDKDLILKIEVGIEWNIIHLSISDFFFSHIIKCFLSHPCNFWLTFKHFLAKNSAFSAACHIQNYWNRKLEKTDFSKSHFQKNCLRSLRWYQKLSYPKCHLFPILYECITCAGLIHTCQHLKIKNLDIWS